MSTSTTDNPRTVAFAAGDSNLHIVSRLDSNITRCSKPVLYTVRVREDSHGLRWCDKCVRKEARE